MLDIKNIIKERETHLIDIHTQLQTKTDLRAVSGSYFYTASGATRQYIFKDGIKYQVTIERVRNE